MKFPRKAIILSAIGLIATGGLFAAHRTGFDIGQAITQSRCSAGAFMYHDFKAAGVQSDVESSDKVAHQDSNASVPQNRAKVLGGNLIPNSGAEEYIQYYSGRVEPVGWNNNIYGQNKATFSVVPGHESDRAFRTSITDYTNGDADWYYGAVKVQPGGYYRYTDYYRSDSSHRAVLMLKDAAGHKSYINLKSAGPAADWTRYQVTFFVPSDTVEVMVYHPLATKGYLETDDFSLIQVEPEGFSRPMLSITFDDGWRSIHDKALPLMEHYGIVSTQYIVTGYVGQNKSYVTPAQVYDFAKSGHEIASHTVSHAKLTDKDPKTAQFELVRSSQDLAKCFSNPASFAAPYGAYNTTTNKMVQQYYQTGRSTDTGFNTADNLSPYGLLVQNVSSSTTHEELNAWLDLARRDNAWLILVYHQVDDSEGGYARTSSDFERDLQAIKVSGIPVLTVSQAYKEAAAQVKP